MREDELTLARRIEALTKPERLTDCLVWLLVGDEMGHHYSGRGTAPIRPAEIVKGRWFGSALEKYPGDIEGVASDWRVPLFTASYDAADATVPGNVGSVIWAPVGKKPSSSMQVFGFWTGHNFGCNPPCAHMAGSLRARHALRHLAGTDPDGEGITKLEELWR